MKFGFVSDLHLGSSYALGITDPATQLNSRLLDFVATFNSIIDRFKQEGVEAVVIPGDIGDTRSLSSVVLNAFSKCLKCTLDKGLEVIILAGNHDISRSTDSTTIDYLDHLGLDRVSVFAKPGVKSFKDCHLVMLPYRDRKQLKASTNEEAARAIKAQIAELTQNLTGPKIAVAHFMIDSAPTGTDGENFSINEVVLPFNTFSEVSMVVAGHVHSAAVLRKSNPIALYVGSMEKITFGDRDCKKSTIIVDTEDLAGYRVIETPTRSLFELSLDYSGDKPLKDGITARILKDVSDFAATNEVKGAIIRLVVKMKDSDTYYVNQDRIRERLLAAGVSCLAGVQISSTSSRQLRDESINENEDSKKAFKAFVGNLKEPDAIKKRLLKFGELIIEEVEGK